MQSKQWVYGSYHGSVTHQLLNSSKLKLLYVRNGAR